MDQRKISTFFQITRSLPKMVLPTNIVIVLLFIATDYYVI